MENYRVKIKTAGSKLIFRGKVVRTPVVLKNVSKPELEIIQMFVRQNLLECKVKLEKDALVEDAIKSLPPEEPIFEEDINKEIIIEELEKKPLSLLEKLIESEEDDEEIGDLSGE